MTERLDRIEHVLAGLAERQKQDTAEMRQLWRDTQAQMAETDRRLRTLGEETDRRFCETDQQIRQTQKEIRETNARLQELGEQTDRRIQELVSARGSFIRGRNG